MAKPIGWNDMDEFEKMLVAQQLLKSVRGKYVIARALHIGVKELGPAPTSAYDQNDVEDMEIFYETIFSQFRPALEIEEPFQREVLVKDIMRRYDVNRG